METYLGFIKNKGLTLSRKPISPSVYQSLPVKSFLHLCHPQKNRYATRSTNEDLHFIDILLFIRIDSSHYEMVRRIRARTRSGFEISRRRMMILIHVLFVDQLEHALKNDAGGVSIHSID